MYNLHNLWYTHSSLARLPDRAPRQQTVNATSEVPLIPIFPVWSGHSLPARRPLPDGGQPPL